jgi:hypothetical protein
MGNKPWVPGDPCNRCGAPIPTLADKFQPHNSICKPCGNARHYADKCVELEAHVADLRGALDWINRRGGCGLDVHDRIRAVCARTPAQSLGRMKAEALREMARLFMATANSDLSYHNRDLAARFCNAEADRLEKKATNGTN